MKSSIYLSICLIFFSSCSTFKNQASQVTDNVNYKKNKDFIDSCEQYTIKQALEMLSQNKKEWSKIDFSDSEALEEFALFIKKDVDKFVLNNKNYLKIKGTKKSYVVLEKEFYQKLFSFIEKKDDMKFSWKSFKEFILPWN